MLSRRLLDVLAVLSSSCSVTAEHFTIRAEQLRRYANTSSFGTSLNSRFPSPNLDERNAAFSATSFTSSDSAKSDVNQSSAQSTDSDSIQPAYHSARNLQKDRGLGQDHFYGWSGKNTSIDSPPKDDLPVDQHGSSAHPLPDSTIPPQSPDLNQGQLQSDTFSSKPTTKPAVGLLKAEHASHSGDSSIVAFKRPSVLDPTSGQRNISPVEVRKAQRRAEAQIPSRQAEPPSGDAFEVENNVELGVDQGQDTFHRPLMESSPVLSALPRVKIPKKAGVVQEKGFVLSNGVNSDTYNSRVKSSTETSDTSEPQSERLNANITKDMMQELFHSKRVAGILSNQSKRPVQTTTAKVEPSTKSSESATNLPPEERKQRDIHADTQKGSDQGMIMNAPWTDKLVNRSADSGTNCASGMSSTMPISKPELDRTSETSQFQMRESRVPSSRIGRIWQYAGLASSMTFGAVGESLKRATGGSNRQQGSLMLSAANMERLVSKLSKMRGAALKLGQMMSFQDSKLLPAPIHEVLQRVQDSADFMPTSQRDAVLAANLGKNWRELFESFDEKPLAAASIGQVHGAVLKSNKRRVVVKVQYPGVATSIDSDLSNLSILLTASRLLPKGLYLEKTIANARTELAWECDYRREADCGKKFRSLLKDEESIFAVPEMIDEVSGKEVLTMERMDGIAVTRVLDLSQEERDWIGTQILRLCLREILDFHYMQTDPNWTNFLLNRTTKKLELLDFGASREYPDNFINLYARNLEAASRGDRSACKDLSVELGYLTGYESRLMTDAHVESVMTLAEPFATTAPEVYNFKEQTITDRVKALIPIMVRERLSAPPEETYSLHRKLSGAFLLCARLGSRVSCREMFDRAMEQATLR